ncbi:MAG: hypothetical protein AABO41_01165 [Acidobacteriota bacterium]
MLYEVAMMRRFLTAGSVLLFLIVSSADGQIQLQKPKVVKPLPNPSIIVASRDEVVSTTKQMLETREIPLDKEDCNQVTGECILISKSVVFTKGIPTRSQLEHYCEVPSAAVRNWVRGRYVLRVQITPASTKTAQVGVYAKFEGMTDGMSGSEWVPLTSKGELEDSMLRCIQDRVQGGDCKDILR